MPRAHPPSARRYRGMFTSRPGLSGPPVHAMASICGPHRPGHDVENRTPLRSETSTLRNARCGFCPYPTLEPLGNQMSGDLIDKIIAGLKAIP